ncbi:Probable helicase HelY [Durusdinium trenchii]|uniref:Probable helicase HelY n=1 Tax=Durusdinium trenchii TaxID=1381693 RepID=A0ABP0R444_9DINO
MVRPSLEILFSNVRSRERGLELYDAQREAIEQIFDDVHVVLNTPTGSGKSLVAMAMLFRAVAEEARAYYTCPVKALVSEKFFALCRDFGSELIGMATGDVSINSQASIICCTAEVLANVALRGANHDLQYAVMDEFHFFADKGRGYAWEVPLFRLPQVTFLLMSATMGRNEALNANLERFTGREVSVVTSTERPVPLDWSYLFKNVREAIFELVADGRAPIYVVSFTQDAAATLAQSLITKELAPSEEQKHTLSEAMKSTDFDTPYGPSLRALLLNGIGLHHAGLIPKYRLLVEQMAQSGLLTCICGTDTLGVGVNVPIRSVLFTQLCKYNGESTALLSARDFHQIAGRAGRKGFDEAGSVVAVAPAHEVYNQKHGLIEKLKEEIKEIRRRGRRRRRRRETAPRETVDKCWKLQEVAIEKPKQKASIWRRARTPGPNFVRWTQKTFEELTESSPAALESQFQLSQGHVLSVLQGAQERADGRATSVDGTSAWHGREELRELIELSVCSEEKKQHWQEQASRRDEPFSMRGEVAEKRRQTDLWPDYICCTPMDDTAKTVESYISALGVAGLVELHGDEIRVDSTLQRDFLLMEDVSLFLVDVLPLFQWRYSTDPRRLARAILQVVEALCEGPVAVMRAQARHFSRLRYAAASHCVLRSL